MFTDIVIKVDLYLKLVKLQATTNAFIVFEIFEQIRMMVTRIMIHKSMCAVEKVAQGKGGWDCCSFNEGGKDRPHWAIIEQI